MNLPKQLAQLADRLHYIANGGDASIAHKQTIGQLRREIRETRDGLRYLASKMQRRSIYR